MVGVTIQTVMKITALSQLLSCALSKALLLGSDTFTFSGTHSSRWLAASASRPSILFFRNK